MRLERLVLALILGIQPGASAFAGETWAPPVESILHPLPGTTVTPEQVRGRTVSSVRQSPRADLLIVAGAIGLFESREKFDAAVSAFETHNKPVLRYAGRLESGAESFDRVAIVGEAAQAHDAFRRLVDAALKDKRRAEHPLVVRLAMDALVDAGDRTLAESVKDPAHYYSLLFTRWVLGDPRFGEGRTLEIEISGRGVARKTVSVGSGKKTLVKLELTDLATLLRGGSSAGETAKKSLNLPAIGAGADGKGAPWIGSPLASGGTPMIRFGRGDAETEGVQATIIKGDGVGELGSIRISARLKDFGETGGAGELTLIRDKTMAGEFNRVDMNWIGTGGQTMNHGAMVRYQMNQNKIESYRLFRGAYVNRLDLGPLRNEAKVKVGYLSGENRYGSSTMQVDPQLLYGAENVTSLSARLRQVRITAEAGGRATFAQIRSEREFDNAMVHGGLQAQVPVGRDLNLQVNATHSTEIFDKKRYFFLKEITRQQVLGAATWAHGGLSASILGGVAVHRGNQADDVQKKAGLQLGVGSAALTALATHGQWMKQHTIALSNVFKKVVRLEGFVNIDRPTSGGGAMPVRAGLTGQYRFGGEIDSKPIIDESRYRPELAKGDPYAERFHQDRKISLADFTARMDSIRKITEFVGANVTWITGSQDKWSRYPHETYIGRGGDCDEQGWLISKVLNDNPNFRGRGNKAYVFVYWAGFGGHAVSLVEEDGRTFISEYGKIWEVVVPAGATLLQKATAAMEQVGPELALRPTPGEGVEYGVYGTNVIPTGGTFDWGYFNDPRTAMVYVGKFRGAAGAPRRETGIRTKIGGGFDD